MCKASHTLLSTVSEQRFVYHLDMLDYKCSINSRNKPSWYESNKNQETISIGPGKETCQSVFLVLALILWGDWIPSEVSVDFPCLLKDKVIPCSWKSHLSVKQLINTTTNSKNYTEAQIALLLSHQWAPGCPACSNSSPQLLPAPPGHSSQPRRARDLLTLTLLTGLHPTLVKGLRAPKGRR